MPTPLRGYQLLNTAVKQIEKHPKTWNQDCPITMEDCPRCVLAHVAVLSGQYPGQMRYDLIATAKALCGLSGKEATQLFNSTNTLKRIKTLAKKFEVKSKKKLK